jgi:hypothetical protein
MQQTVFLGRLAAIKVFSVSRHNMVSTHFAISFWKPGSLRSEDLGQDLYPSIRDQATRQLFGIGRLRRRLCFSHKLKNSEKSMAGFAIKWIYSAAIPGSSARGLFCGRAGVFQALFYRTGSYPAALTQPVLRLPEKNLRPLRAFLRLVPLGDEISRKKTNYHRAQKRYREIISHLVFHSIDCDDSFPSRPISGFIRIIFFRELSILGVERLTHRFTAFLRVLIRVGAGGSNLRSARRIVFAPLAQPGSVAGRAQQFAHPEVRLSVLPIWFSVGRLDLYFHGVGLGLRIIVGATLDLCAAVFVIVAGRPRRIGRSIGGSEETIVRRAGSSPGKSAGCQAGRERDRPRI